MATSDGRDAERAEESQRAEESEQPEHTDESEQAEQDQEPEGSEEVAAVPGEAVAPDELVEGVAAAVRPYAWTGGRTRPVYELEVETLVSTSEYGRDVASLTSVEHRAVADLCSSACSVAEIAALLSLPLGVARVVVGDMAEIGLVEVHQSSAGQTPDVALMERVLSGLRRL